MTSACDVAIVGGGIGGLTLAISLVQQSISVRIFEQDSELREIGAGVAIGGNATRLLQRLGLDLAQVANVPPAFEVRCWKDGGLLWSQPRSGDRRRLRPGRPSGQGRADGLRLGFRVLREPPQTPGLDGPGLLTSGRASLQSRGRCGGKTRCELALGAAANRLDPQVPRGTTGADAIALLLILRRPGGVGSSPVW
jgi:putative NAD(P)-binding protein